MTRSENSQAVHKACKEEALVRKPLPTAPGADEEETRKATWKHLINDPVSNAYAYSMSSL
jgi:hypothetical protein